MKWTVKLTTGLFSQFEEIVEAASSDDAKRTALARNPTAKVISCWPTGSGSPVYAGLFFAVIVAVGSIIAGSLGFIKVEDQPVAQENLPQLPEKEVKSTQQYQESSVNSEAQPNVDFREQRELWGAFAISPSTSESSYATGYSSEEEAKQAALKSCGQTDCNILTAFGPGYATLAESDRNWFYSVGMSSEAEAANEAMLRCQEKDPDYNCRITTNINF